MKIHFPNTPTVILSGAQRSRRTSAYRNKQRISPQHSTPTPSLRLRTSIYFGVIALLTLLLILPLSLFSQSPPKKAEQLFQEGAYTDAAKLYERFLRSNKS